MALVFVLPGCGKSAAVSNVALAVNNQPNCLSGQDHLWSELYRQVDENGELPLPEAVESEIRGLARTRAQGEALVDAYSSIAREIRLLNRNLALVRLAEMEMGDRTTAEKAARQDEIERNLSHALSASVAALGNCPAPPPVSIPIGNPVAVPMFEAWRTSVAAPLYGAYKAISIGYQSCNAVSLSPLTTSVSSVVGITVTGTHPSGVGLKREVTDPAAVFRTNPFYAGRSSPTSGCFPAPSTPLIYDYGGKPYTTTALGGSIDFFQNNGSGTDALGIDCSGFIATAVLAGGLRFKQNVTSKAPQAGGVNAAMFADPAGNGLSCFSPLRSTPTESLRSGDIIANTGHVIMVDQVGADPFGIAGAKTVGDCNQVTSSKFSFIIIQSSPSKGGIGMNRYLAADYLSEAPSMRTGLEAYAKSFCRVRLGLDSPSTLANPSTAVIIRNIGGTACTDSPVALAGQECLQSCSPATPI